MQAQNSNIKKPTAWASNGATWDGVPVLAYPIRHGWALWEATRERVIAAYDGDSYIPEYVSKILYGFTPNEDYKKMEVTIHNTIRWLFTQYHDTRKPDKPIWTRQNALIAIGDTEEYTTNPYFLDALWLWQSYKFVNLLEMEKIVLPFVFIDEAHPVYTATPEPYASDRAEFDENVKDNVALFHVEAQVSHGIGTVPPNVLYYTCARYGENYSADLDSLKSAFVELRNQYPEIEDRYFNVGIFVDNSGSMGYATISTLVEALKSWINDNYDVYIIETLGAEDERWLKWTSDYVSILRKVVFNFYASVRVDIPD